MAPQGFARRVLRWQRAHGRHDLPWQQDRDPYRVWLSEVMLQQTQVATVRAYYARFLERFPDLQRLAAAPLDDVLACWSGLGYYSRARNLHRCAQRLCAEHGGRFPRSSAALAQLPGIGRSTAAAIAALCFDEPVAILDGNARRVLARCLGWPGDLRRPAELRRLWLQAQALVPARAAAAYTQGLMDLGALVCTARVPGCARCPLAPVCVAHAQGQPLAYPLQSPPRARGRRCAGLLWLEQRDRLWLVQRPLRGVWAGLWSLPEAPSAAVWRRRLRGWPGEVETLAPIAHALTHFDWRLEPLRWRLPPRLGAAQLRALVEQLPAGRWVDTAQAAQLALPAPVRQLLFAA